MSPLACSLLALAALLAAADATKHMAMFGTDTFISHVVQEQTLPPTGGEVFVGNGCGTGSDLTGQHVTLTNGRNDRDPWVYGPPHHLTVVCHELGSYETCNEPIKVKVRQFCIEKEDEMMRSSP